MLTEDEQKLKEEVEQLKAEKDRIKEIMGNYGGKKSAKKDRLVNYFFAFMVLALFVLSLLRFVGVEVYFDVDFYIEVGVMLISLKIIWMIHRQSQIFHSQFWILNSIEFRVTNLSNKIKKIEKEIN